MKHTAPQKLKSTKKASYLVVQITSRRAREKILTGEANFEDVLVLDGFVRRALDDRGEPLYDAGRVRLDQYHDVLGIPLRLRR